MQEAPLPNRAANSDRAVPSSGPPAASAPGAAEPLVAITNVQVDLNEDEVVLNSARREIVSNKTGAQLVVTQEEDDSPNELEAEGDKEDKEGRKSATEEEEGLKHKEEAATLGEEVPADRAKETEKEEKKEVEEKDYYVHESSADEWYESDDSGESGGSDALYNPWSFI